MIRRVGLAVCGLFVACEADPPTEPAVARILADVPRAVRACVGAGEAPLRTGNSVDDVVCVRVGATRVDDRTPWPAVTPAPAVVWVDPMARGGDGSRDAPFATIADALRAPVAARTIVLHAGVHPIAEALNVDRAVTVVGVGAGATVLSLARGSGAFTVAPTGVLVLRGVTAAWTGGVASDGDVAVRSRGDTSLDEVEVRGPAEGISADAGALRLSHTTVERASRTGVALTGDVRAVVDTLWIREGAGQGLRVVGARVFLRRSLIEGNARHGIVMSQPPSARGFGDCEDPEAPGALDCIDQTVARENGVAALYVEGARRGEVQRVTLRDTRLATVGVGTAGDGAAVVGGATVRFDAAITTVARRGFGSEVSGNARVGVLVQGDGAACSLRGAWMLRNAVGAVVLAEGARAEVIGECLMVENHLGGVVVAPGASAGIVQCNGIADTVEGTTSGMGGVTLADGIHLNGALGDTVVRDNVVEHNTGFGLIANRANASLDGNRGQGNRYGIAGYAGSLLTGNVSGIRGREAPPATPPALVGAIR